MQNNAYTFYNTKIYIFCKTFVIYIYSILRYFKIEVYILRGNTNEKEKEEKWNNTSCTSYNHSYNVTFSRGSNTNDNGRKWTNSKISSSTKRTSKSRTI